MNLNIPLDIRFILDRLEEEGFEAYLTGRELCELISSQNIHSCTVTTNAQYADIKRIFPKTVETNNGNINIIHKGIGYDIRIMDNETITDICNKAVFTINSMAYSIKTGLIDKHNAMEDIKNKLIRSVKTDENIFLQRPLSMLKAITLCAVLDYKLEDKTRVSITKSSAAVKRVKSEKVFREINRILLSPHPDYIRMLHETNTLCYIMPQLNRCFGETQRNKYHIYDVGEHIMHALTYVRSDRVLRWATLLHDIGKPLTSSTDENGIIHFYGHYKESKNIGETILRQFRVDSDEIREILLLIENHDVRIDTSSVAVKRMMSRLGSELFLKLLELQAADNMAKNMIYFPAKKEKLDNIKRIHSEVIASNEPYSVNHLMINSRDLASVGFKKGRMMADALKSLVNEVIINPSLNNREYLIKRARQIYSRH